MIKWSNNGITIQVVWCGVELSAKRKHLKFLRFVVCLRALTMKVKFMWINLFGSESKASELQILYIFNWLS